MSDWKKIARERQTEERIRLQDVYETVADFHKLEDRIAELEEEIAELHHFIPASVTKTHRRWENAPSWANYIATDKNGNSYWYEYVPIAHHGKGCWTNVIGMHESADIIRDTELDWRDSLQRRPGCNQ